MRLSIDSSKEKRTKNCEVSSNVHHKEIPHTKTSWKEKVKKYKSLGFDEVCEKPLNHDVLRAIFKKYLSYDQFSTLKNID